MAITAIAGADELPERPAPPPSPEAHRPAEGASGALTAADLEGGSLRSLDAIAAATPAATLTPSLNSGNTPILFMRAQGLSQSTQITRDTAVGVYEDGFYIARPQALTSEILALDHVEVLRGPQAVLYGRDTTGGVLSLVSAQPSGELRLRESVEAGGRDFFRVLSSIDAPEWHGVAARVTVLVRSIKGYVKNEEPRLNDYGVERERAGRLQLSWGALPGTRAEYSLEKMNLDSTPDYDTDPYLNGRFLYFFFQYSANPRGPMRTTYRPVNLPLSTSDRLDQRLILSWSAPSGFTLKSRTGYRTLKAAAFHDYAEALGISEQTEDGYRHRQFSQELQFAGGAPEGPLRYTGGVSYFKEGGWHDAAYGFQTLFRTIEHDVGAGTRSRAAYLSVQWDPALARRPLQFTLGGRYTSDAKHAERFVTDTALGTEESGAASGAVHSLSYRRFSPAATVDYRWAEGRSAYATVSSGYRAGGALETAPLHEFGRSTFRPESLVSYELGVKRAFLGGRAHAAGAAFASRYRDIQYAIPIDAVTDEVYTLRQASIRGVDLGLAASPSADLTLRADAAYLHWTMDRVEVLRGTPLDPATGSGSPYRVGEEVGDLFALPYAPKYRFTAAADGVLWRGYTADLRAHLDYAYRSEFYNDPAAGRAVPGSGRDTTPAVGLLNARLALTTEADRGHQVTIGLWGRNLLNRKYLAIARGYGSGVSAFLPRPSGAAVPFGWLARIGAWAEPATYGMSVSYEY